MCVMVLLLFSYVESEHNFMDRDSQDDLVSSVRSVSIHTCDVYAYMGSLAKLAEKTLKYTC